MPIQSIADLRTRTFVLQVGPIEGSPVLRGSFEIFDSPGKVEHGLLPGACNPFRLLLDLSSFVELEDHRRKHVIDFEFGWLKDHTHWACLVCERPILLADQDCGFWAITIPDDPLSQVGATLDWWSKKERMSKWLARQRCLTGGVDRLVCVVGLNQPFHVYTLLSFEQGKWQDIYLYSPPRKKTAKNLALA